MNKLRYFIVICLILILTACTQSEPTFYETSGKKIQFSQYRGKWIIINYWAKWCRSCISEIAVLNTFYHQHKNKAVVLGVSYDSLPVNELKNLVHKLKFEFPVLQQDPGDYLKLGAIDVVPTTIIINPNGKIVKALRGPQTEASLNNVIQGK